MQSVSSRVWTRVTEFISYDNNYYTTGTETNYKTRKEITMQRALHLRNDVLKEI